MTSSNAHVQYPRPLPLERTQATSEFLTMDELQHIIRLLDQSDISELEVRSTENGARLVLRKAQPQQGEAIQTAIQAQPEDATHSEQARYTITAPLVGIFRTGPREKPLVQPGDSIKAGQHVAIIQALNLPNEVESPVAGRVLEVLVENGQAVEYGQPLLIIEQ